MRPLSLSAAALVIALSFASGVRAEYRLFVATPDNINDVPGLKIEATSEPSGLVRFVVIREAPPSPSRSQGLFRLEREPSVATEVYVAGEERSGAIEYRVTVAPSDLDVAEFNIVEQEGRDGMWFRLPLKAFAPKQAAGDAGEKPSPKNEESPK